MRNGRGSFQADFYTWIDEVLSQPLPVSTEAFHFNLYEGEDSVRVQIACTDAFAPGENPSTDFWPGAEVFSTGENLFSVPFAVAGADWRQWLETIVDWVTVYLADDSRSEVLRSKAGVGLGFVDGDMYILWRRDAA